MKLFPATLLDFGNQKNGRRASFYLAAEEYVALNSEKFQERSYLFSWQLSPTVVVGRHQVLHREIDLSFCKDNGIDIIRRKSGGGAIFAEENNIMWSLVTVDGRIEDIFSDYAESMAAALNEIGAQVKLSGRNDIILENGGKICGNAFYHLGRRNIVHGTMLYDTDLWKMSNALKPDDAKLKSYGVKSVRSRIGLLKDVLPSEIGVAQIRSQISSILTKDSYSFSQDDLAEIEQIEKEYLNPSFIMGNVGNAQEVVGERFDRIGHIELHFTLRGSTVKKVEIAGDIFAVPEVSEEFSNIFKGVVYSKDSLRSALLYSDFQPEKYVRGLNKDLLLKLIDKVN